MQEGVKRKHSSCTVKVVGAGVAGSILAYLLQRRGVKTRVYDIKSIYDKPCGEAIPVETMYIIESLMLPAPHILNYIKRFMLFIDKHLVKDIEFSHSIWYIIDKSSWINSLRENIKDNMIIISGKRIDKIIGAYCLVFDARGPYANIMYGGVIPVIRYYIETREWPADTIALILKPSRRIFGLAWVFPHGNGIVNAGGGFLGIHANVLENIVLEYIKSVVGEGNRKKLRIIDKKYSVITIKPKLVLKAGKAIKLGEAAGLILPLGGEGIRPSIVSASAASSSLKYNPEKDVVDFDYKKYKQLLRSIIREVKLQKHLLSITMMLGEWFAEKLLDKASIETLLSWFNGRLTVRSLLSVFSKPL